MYFSALRKAIQNLEEKRFYDIAIMYLNRQGYKELSIVDGAGDGGRDVTCSRDDLRVQLSVRRDWENKLNDEADKTLKSGRRHLIYVTNRAITPAAQEDFLNTKYRRKGDVDLSIHDLNRISTALAHPGTIRRAYEMVGVVVEPTISASPKQIALSTVLLFSDEARELRENVIEANVRAWLLKNPGCPENALVHEVSKLLPGANVERGVNRAISRLRSIGRIVGSSASVRLSATEEETMKAAETEYLLSIEGDLNAISKTTGLTKAEARSLLDIALELLVRGKGAVAICVGI